MPVELVVTALLIPDGESSRQNFILEKSVAVDRLSPMVDTSRLSRRRGAGGTVANRAVVGAPDKGSVSRRAEQEVRNEGVISIGASSYEQPAAGSGQADSALTSPSTARPTVGSTSRGSIE